MSQREQVDRRESELVRLALTGEGEAWERLQAKVFSIIETIATRIQESTPASEGVTSSTTDVAKDILRIAGDWAKAKVERPSLENSKLRAEIASEFAEAKRRLAEARKAEAEAAKLEQELHGNRLNQDIENLERLLTLAGLMAHVQFARIGPDAHLLLSAGEIGEPNGDGSKSNKADFI